LQLTRLKAAGSVRGTEQLVYKSLSSSRIFALSGGAGWFTAFGPSDCGESLPAGSDFLLPGTGLGASDLDCTINILNEYCCQRGICRHPKAAFWVHVHGERLSEEFTLGNVAGGDLPPLSQRAHAI